MCKTYNTIGSLTALKSHLEKSSIYDFKSLKEVIDFQNSYPNVRQQLISHHKTLIEQETNTLKMDLKQLDITIERQKQQTEQKLRGDINNLKQQLNILKGSKPINFIRKLSKYLRHWNYKRQIKFKEQNFDRDVKESIKTLINNYHVKSNRYNFITSDVNEAVRQSAQNFLPELDRKKNVIDDLNSYIYGAIGEQKVVKALETLSDDYFLINDFAVSFSPAIYNKQDDDYIKSVQIDHILVGPAGVFLIETKNWNEKSLENLNLRSPVQQIKRTSFILFKLLNNNMGNHQLNLDNHHWGDQKVSIRNLIVLTNNTKPNQEFQYVKILTLNELSGYVNYFKPTFTINESQRIADFILDINQKKTIRTK